MALSDKKSESNISFNSNSLVSVDNQTVATGGQYSVPEIEIGYKCDYIKLLVNKFELKRSLKMKQMLNTLHIFYWNQVRRNTYG